MQFIPISASQEYCKMDKRTILIIIFTCLGIVLSSLIIWCLIQLSTGKEDEDVLEPAKGNMLNIHKYKYTSIINPFYILYDTYIVYIYAF